MACALNGTSFAQMAVKQLPSNIDFDRVLEKTKPELRDSGQEKTRDSEHESAKNETLNNPILADVPNFYKNNGTSVSKIPYFFETPVPKYFRESGWFKNENTWKYVTWAFSKCQTQPHAIVIEGKEIILAPYEFISGRLTSPKECFLTENIFRNQQKMLVNAGFLKKTTNSITNHYSCYVWVTERFCKTDNQQNNQPRTNHAPTVNHKSEEKKIRREEDHPLTPSFEKKDGDGLNDDLFSKEEDKNKIHVFTGKYPNGTQCAIYLSKQEYQECIDRRGSKEKIEDVIQQVINWPGRKYEIKDWFKTIKDWKFKNIIADRTSENEEKGKRIEQMYGEAIGWKARIYRDTIKDQRGILFEGEGAVMVPIFVAFSDASFLEKIKQTIAAKKMKPIGVNR